MKFQVALALLLVAVVFAADDKKKPDAKPEAKPEAKPDAPAAENKTVRGVAYTDGISAIAAGGEGMAISSIGGY